MEQGRHDLTELKKYFQVGVADPHIRHLSVSQPKFCLTLCSDVRKILVRFLGPACSSIKKRFKEHKFKLFRKSGSWVNQSRALSKIVEASFTNTLIFIKSPSRPKIS